DRAQAQQSDERYHRRSRYPQADDGARPRDRAAAAAQPGISRPVPAGGNRALGQADSRRRHQRGLKFDRHGPAFAGMTAERLMRNTIAAVIAVFASASWAVAQEWPNRAITMVVPFAAGGPIDVAGRILAQPMGELLGQQIVIENIGGGGGMTGSSRGAKAAPHRHQFLYGHPRPHPFRPPLYTKPPHHP